MSPAKISSSMAVCRRGRRMEARLGLAVPPTCRSMNRITESESLILDVIRAAAAQMVLVGHVFSFGSGGKALIGGTYPIQNLGVVVFFVLSGYLICTTTRQKAESDNSYSFGTFFIERFARIYVTFIPCLLVIAALDGMNVALPGFQYQDAFNLTTFLGNLLMLQDLIRFPWLHRFP